MFARRIVSVMRSAQAEDSKDAETIAKAQAGILSRGHLNGGTNFRHQRIPAGPAFRDRIQYKILDLIRRTGMALGRTTSQRANERAGLVGLKRQ
ncbi:hypothetical protein PENARI_c050G10806 [Penicillium arizonense]|uniref:Uncharacterized protein n=1 Tax=Penicillium arizonense TaxID=1835702 RepID=A0A1F5L269_PENAI|nr:hypothetical protein PENARI_c050G10806 [Penicillium arizonense]OGE47304.1 hypothetical protein PENARI_c050G10806 [Penicillium arizonense]